MTAEAVRYYNAARQRRIEEEARKVAEINRSKGASDFLKHGPGVRDTLENIDTRKQILHPGAVSDAAGIMLTREADKAFAVLENALKWSPYEVERGSRKVSEPFPEYPHRKETLVGIINRGGGAFVAVTMTNFRAEEIEPQQNGSLLYKGVAKPRDGVAERPTLAVHGILRSQDGEIEVDPSFTSKGLAWKADNIETVAKACYEAATRNTARPGQHPELESTPADQRPDFAQLRAQQAAARQQQRREPSQRDHGMTL